MTQDQELGPGAESDETTARRRFGVILEVLGGKRVPAGPGDAKLTHLFLDYPASDIDIDARGVRTRRAETVRPKRCSWDRYLFDPAPVAVGHLMDRAGLARISEPTVATIRSAPIWII